MGQVLAVFFPVKGQIVNNPGFSLKHHIRDLSYSLVLLTTLKKLKKKKKKSFLKAVQKQDVGQV